MIHVCARQRIYSGKIESLRVERILLFLLRPLSLTLLSSHSCWDASPASDHVPAVLSHNEMSTAAPKRNDHRLIIHFVSRCSHPEIGFDSDVRGLAFNLLLGLRLLLRGCL